MMASSMDSLPALLRQTASTSASKAAVPDNLEEPSSSAYNQLLAFTSQSLSSLREQPAALETSKNSLELQLSTLCSRHVHSFVRVRTATASLPTSLEKLDQQLEALIERDLPALSEASQAFTGAVVPSIEAKERARNLLDQYDLSIKDLLDIPRLVMTCARASHPIEALQLGTHMAKIVQTENRSKEDGRSSTLLLTALRDECWVHLKQLRSDLLRDLGARGVRLPAARRYLSLLRRLELVDAASSTKEEDGGSTRLALSASTICLSYLQSRWVTVEEIGTHETDEDLTTQTYSQISAWRDAVGESCTIALALFGDAKIPSAVDSDEVTPLTLISSFASLCLDKLEDIVKRQLPRVVQSAKTLLDAFESLDTLHTQMAYAASSLSRQGLDFSQLSGCAAVFEQQALHTWSDGLNSVVTEVEPFFTKQSVGDTSVLLGTTNAGDILQSSLSSAEPITWSEEAARYPPLAQLANNMLDLYEAFIVFAPLTVGDKAIDIFDKTLERLVRQLFTLIRELEGRGEETTSRLQLPPMRGNQHNSLKRYHEADLALCAKFSRAMCATVLPSLRNIVLEAFESRRDVASTAKQLLDDAIAWSLQSERAWTESERVRIKRADEEEAQHVAQEKERLRLADEQKMRDEEERRRKAEMQARLEAEEAARKAEEAKIRAREEEQRRRLEEQRKEKEEHEKRLEEGRQRQLREEEAVKAREAEAKAKETERLAAIERAALEEAERTKRAEEERLEREMEEARIAAELRRQEEENEKRRQEEAVRREEEEELLRRQREAEELQRQKETAEQEEQARLERERSQPVVEAAHAGESVSIAEVAGHETANSANFGVADKTDDNITRIISDNANASEAKQSIASADHQTDLVQAEVRAEEVKQAEQSATSEDAVQSVTQASDNPISNAAVPQAQAQDDKESTATKVQARPANRLAEKLRKRQEERERAAAAAKKKAEEGG